MPCTYCQKEIPSDAVYCIYCGSRLPVQPLREAGSPVAATGKTIDLGRPQTIVPRPPVTSAPFAPGRPAAPRRQQRSQGQGWMWLGLLLVLLLFFRPALFLVSGLFFLTWPGLLLLFGLLYYSKQLRRGRQGQATRSLIWVGGIMLLLATKTFWPGILVLFLVMHMLRPRRVVWP